MDSIVCLLEVKFDCHETRICFTCFEAVNDLLDNNLILDNPSIGNESRLSGRNDPIEERAELSYQQL